MSPEWSHQIIAKVVSALLASGALGALLIIFIKHRLDIDRDRMMKLEDKIIEEKSQFIPFLKQIISDANRRDPLQTWRHYKGDLQDSVSRFGTFLKGRRKASFDAAWQICSDTKDSELLDEGKNFFAKNRAAEMKIAQQLLISRLRAILDCVEKS